VTTPPETGSVDLRAFSLGARSRRLAALMKKEALQIVRDPSSILIAFVLPVILLFLFGYGVSLDTTRTRIGLVLESPRKLSTGMRQCFS
jgi:ABC-2 type transport system permease protein